MLNFIFVMLICLILFLEEKEKQLKELELYYMNPV